MIILSIVPLIAALAIGSFRIKNLNIVALYVSLIVFFISLILFSLDNNTNSFSNVFILLTTFLIPVSILSTLNLITKDTITYYASLLVLESILIIVFLSTTLIEFYCAFELSLVPLFILIIVFGGLNRYRAAFLLFIYTLAGSLFILISFIYIIIIAGGTSDIELLSLIGYLDNLSSLCIWLGLFFSLAIKTPLVPFHIWLPRAHAQANLAGSILLAGIVLKLATYGYIRLLLPFFPSYYLSTIIIIICVVGIIYTSLSAIRITDLKALVAVSSVAHISIVVLGLFSNSYDGIIGAIVLSIAHGFISPAAFFCVGGVLYNRFHTRQIHYYSGLIIIIPLFATLFFITCCGNIAVPLSINFIGEILALKGLFELNPIIATLAASSILLSACYTLFIYNRLTFGSFSRNLSFTLDLSRIEYHILFLFIILTLLLGIYPKPILDYIAYHITFLLF